MKSLFHPADEKLCGSAAEKTNSKRNRDGSCECGEEQMGFVCLRYGEIIVAICCCGRAPSVFDHVFVFIINVMLGLA
jgi:hypothetical protein